MLEYLKFLITPILSDPDSLKITQTNDELGVLFSIDVARRDMGRIIGKNGETAKSIRHLVKVAGVMQKSIVSIKINEPHGE